MKLFWPLLDLYKLISGNYVADERTGLKSDNWKKDQGNGDDQ